jgi:hypothetical protein
MSESPIEIDFVWSTLMSRLTGNAAYDADVIKGFCKPFNVRRRDVIAKIKAHLHRPTGAVH